MILVPGSKFGDELRFLVGMVERLAAGRSITGLIVGGEAGTEAEYRMCLERKWPVIVLAGSGGIADRIAKKHHPYLRGGVRAAWRRHKDPIEVEDLPPATDGANHNIVVAGIRSHAEITRLLQWRLASEEYDGLRVAWDRIEALDELAVRSQPRVNRLRNTALVSVVAAATLGAISQYTPDRFEVGVRAGVVAFSALAAAIFALISKRSTDRRWLALRAAAELVKSATFRYRALGLADAYDERRARLASTLSSVDENLASTVQTATATGVPRVWPTCSRNTASTTDQLLAELSPSQYTRDRLENQLQYYNNAVRRHDVTLLKTTVLSTVLSLALGVGGVLIDAQALIFSAVLTTISSQVSAWLSFNQSETQIRHKSLAAARLASLWSIYYTMPVADRMRVFPQIVDEVELVLVTETNDWMRDLTRVQELFGSGASFGTGRSDFA